MHKKTKMSILYFVAGLTSVLAISAIFCTYLLLKSPYTYKVYVSGFWTIETQLAYKKLSPEEQALLFEYILTVYALNKDTYEPVTVLNALNTQRKLHKGLP